VEQRSKLLFGRPTANVKGNGRRIGIPKALTAHSLYPLYSTFFSGLGMEVILSDIDPRGELKSNAGFCFPAQIAHGAVLDLVQRGVELILLPHVMRMPQREAWNESYLCPITQASPYFLAKAYPRFICSRRCSILATVTPPARRWWKWP
jgi:predicted nucleotide-binding protein (sugar kinase/HSP70/actin superfamily)